MRLHPDKTAFRAVDACGGAYSLEEVHSGWADGHAFALAAALEAVKPVDALMAELMAALTHIAELEIITDAATGYPDDAAQTTARAAIAKATGAA